MRSASKHMRRDALAGTLAALALLLAVPLGLVAASHVLEKTVPENPITTREQAVAAPAMLVSPQTATGDDGAGDGKSDADDKDDSDDQRESQGKSKGAPKATYAGGQGTPSGKEGGQPGDTPARPTAQPHAAPSQPQAPSTGPGKPQQPEQPQDEPEDDARPVLVVTDDAGTELSSGTTVTLDGETCTLRVKALDGNTKAELAQGNLTWGYPDKGKPAHRGVQGGFHVYDLSFKKAINETNPDENGVFSFAYTIDAQNASKSKRTLARPYTITFKYHFKAEGSSRGTARVVIDLSTLGNANMADFDVPLIAKRPFSESFEKVLGDAGYTVDARGLIDAEGKSYNYFITGIEMPTDGLAVAPKLLAMLKAGNKYTFSGSATAQSGKLQENDFVIGSGWMIAKNDKMIGRTLNDVTIDDGDKVTLTFSLAGGADVTQDTSATVNGATLCGTWYGGEHIHHHISEYVVVTAPTCEKDGVGRYECTVEHAYVGVDADAVERCGAYGDEKGATTGNHKTFAIPALGHDWVEHDELYIAPEYDDDGNIVEPGKIYYICSRCGKQRVQEDWK